MVLLLIPCVVLYIITGAFVTWVYEDKVNFWGPTVVNVFFGLIWPITVIMLAIYALYKVLDNIACK